MTDWNMLLEPVARELLGEPNPALSRPSTGELRYGRHGSLSVCIAPHHKAGQWFDHEAGVGGGLLALVERERAGNRVEAIRWLESSGFLEPFEGNSRNKASSTRSPSKPTRSSPHSVLEAQRTALAKQLWMCAVPPEHTPARTYLSRRLVWPPDNIGPNLPATVRWLPRTSVPKRQPDAKWYGMPAGADGAILFAWRPPGDGDGSPVAVSLLAATVSGERVRWFNANGPKVYALGARRDAVFTARTGEGGAIHVTEGELDALALACQRVEGVVRAAGGTSGFGIKAVADPAARTIVLHPDGDRGGFVAAAKAQARILAAGRACRIAWREPESGDPADDLAMAVRERAAIRVEAGEEPKWAFASAWADLLDSEAPP